MKKTIVGIFALALLLTSNNAFASWNNLPADCPLPLSIGNYTTGVGIQDGTNGCWTKTNVSANAGETINVAVFYDNTNNTNANNTVIRLTQSPAGSMTTTNSSYTFSGTLSSSAGNLALSQVTANLTSSQSLTFGQAKWFKQGSNSGISLPNGQTGYEAFNGNGLSLGTIADGDWGTVLFAFSVGTSGNNPNPVNNCTISNFTVNGSSSTTVQSGGSANLVWNTANCTSVTVSGPNMGTNYNLSGNQTIYPTSSGTYTITAYGATGGVQTQTVYVTVNTYVPPVQYNCTISTFTANGSNSVTVSQGAPVTLYWTTNNCTSVSIQGLGTNLPVSGSQIVYPSGNMTYVLTAYGANGQIQTQSVYVNMNQVIVNPPIYVPPTNACAVTGITTNVTRTSVTLNGIVSNPNYYNTTGYFEYGPTINMGYRTNSRSLGGTSIFVESLTGLNPNTVYYYRFVANCQNGVSYGAIDTFSTLGAVTTNTTTTIIRQGTTVIGTQSPIMLTIENRYQTIGVGDVIDYTVTYKNIGKSLLTRPILQVIVPKGITLTNSSRGTISPDTNILTVPLEDLRPGEGGVVYAQARVDSLQSNTAQIVTQAVLVYTNPNGAQENAIAYVLNNPKDINTNLFGASAFFAGIFPTTLLGWLLLIILILLLILLTRRYYHRTTVVAPSYPSSH